MELVSHITKKQNKTEINVMMGRNGFLYTFTVKLFALQSGNFFEYLIKCPADDGMCVVDEG